MDGGFHMVMTAMVGIGPNLFKKNNQSHQKQIPGNLEN